MRRWSIAALALVALAVAGCFPATTTNPVGTTVGLKNDPALLGTWKSIPTKDQPSVGYYHFIASKDGKSITALLVNTSDPKDNGWMLVSLTTARFGKAGFMNARVLSEDGEPEAGAPSNATVPILYRIDAKGVLTLSLADESAVEDAVKSGKIKGTIGKGQFGDVTITADGPALDTFFQSPAGLALYKKPFGLMKQIN